MLRYDRLRKARRCAEDTEYDTAVLLYLAAGTRQRIPALYTAVYAL